MTTTTLNKKIIIDTAVNHREVTENGFHVVYYGNDCTSPMVRFFAGACVYDAQGRICGVRNLYSHVPGNHTVNIDVVSNV